MDKHYVPNVQKTPPHKFDLNKLFDSPFKLQCEWLNAKADVRPMYDTIEE